MSRYLRSSCLFMICIMLFTVNLISAQAPSPNSSPDNSAQTLRRASNEFAYGNFEEAVQLLEKILYPVSLDSGESVQEARKMLGVSYYLTDRQKLAQREFKKLLYLAPNYHLDPYSVPPLLSKHLRPLDNNSCPSWIRPKISGSKVWITT